MRALPLVIAALLAPLPAVVVAEQGPPNTVVFLCDNLGNGDVACFNPKAEPRLPHDGLLSAPRRPVDGHDIRPLLFGDADARSPADVRER